MSKSRKKNSKMDNSVMHSLDNDLYDEVKGKFWLFLSKLNNNKNEKRENN